MLFSRRLHGIELLDIPRCPRAIRDGATDYLQFIIRRGNAYGPIVQILASALRNLGEDRMVDLCSGGGGPWPELRGQLITAGAPSSLSVTLTDAYPNVEAFAKNKARDGMVAGRATPLDIEQESAPGAGIRTFFSSFHHFTPEVARRVLHHAGRSNQPILIAEITERRLPAILFMLLAPLLVWLATPQLRPFSWTRLFLTYVVPAIPFVVCFDGIVSCFRTYSPDEMRALVRQVDDLELDWQVGQARGSAPLSVTFALGLPRSRET